MQSLPPGLTQISAAEATRIIASGTPGLIAQFVGHDDWCKFFITGKVADCNCNPTVEFYRVNTPKVRRG